jgi:hypothetical protein
MAAEEQTQYVPDGFTTDQDGNFVNADGERVYYWTESSELGDLTSRNPEKILYQDTGGYYTEAEIRAAWDADEGMGYLKEQTDWDNYWGYLTERQALIQDGTLFDATGADAAGRKARQDVIQQGGGLRAMGGAKGAATAGQTVRYEGYSDYYTSFLEQPEQVALMAKYGISPVIQNKDGDVFGWNGSSYTKVVKVDDHNYGAIVGQLIKSFVITSLTAGLSQAAVGYLASMSGSVGNIFTAINNFIYGTPPGGSSIAQQAMSRYNRNLIVNFVDDVVNNVDDYTDNGTADKYLENLGKPEGDYTIYGVYGGGLPAGYIFNEARNVVVNEETGEEYPVNPSPWGIRVWLPTPDEKDEGGGGNTGSTDGSTSGGAPMSQAEANATIQEILESGATGNDFFEAVYEAGVTRDQIIKAMEEGVLPRGPIPNTEQPDNTGGEDSDRSGSIVARQLHEAILREGDPTLRDKLIGEWERYTGREYSDDFYDDNPYKGDEERTPIGWRWIPGDNAEGGMWYPVYDPSEIPSDGSYVQGSTAPTEPWEGGDNSGDPNPNPDATPKEGDPCPLPGGAGEGVIKDGECQPRTGVTNAAIVPSLICESGWSDSAGACIPVDDPRISGVNAPNPGQCPVGYSKNRRGECIPNTQGDMGGESEGDNNNGSTPNDGDPCEVDGKEGKYQDGVCVISTNPVNPGVIDLTGASDWGDGGTGGGTGGGNGPGDGPGNGPGNGGNGPGLGDVGARKGSSNPTWSPIPPGYKFRRFQKRQGIGANVPMLNQSLFKGPDLSPMRQGLLTSMQNDLKRPKS